MVAQAAKIIGSGLATIGLIDVLLSLLIQNKDLYLSEIVYIELAKRAIFTTEEMIKSLPEVNLVLKFLYKEIPLSILKHKYQFNNRRRPTTLHVYKYKYFRYNWSPIYLSLNYYKLFVYKHPYYVLSKGEIDILIAITQLLSRILEQSLFYNFSFNLNGENKLVKFSYTNWYSSTLNLPMLKNKMSKCVDIIINEKVVRTVNSIQDLLAVLGVKCRNTLSKYMNHVKGFYSPTYHQIVNIRYPHINNHLKHEIIHRRTKVFPELNIPNTSLRSLTVNLLYVYNTDLSLFNIYNSIKEAAQLLNPNYKTLDINIRGREIAISRAKNK